jgi:hypothetical protein
MADVRGVHASCAVAFPRLCNEFAGNDFVPGRAALSLSERADVDEHSFATAIRGNEAETPLVVPVCDSSLIAHG